MKDTVMEILKKFVDFIDDLVNKFLEGIEIDLF